MRRSPNVFSIPPGVDFLATLVDALNDGSLVPDFDGSDPLALSRATFYVPTQRAARALRASFIAKMQARTGAQACLLPDIRPLGALGHEAEAPDFSNFAYASEAALALPSPIDALERVLLLARLIRPWRERLPQHLRALFGREQVALPTNSADAIWLAHDLATLIDEIDREEVDPQQLAHICPDDVAEWWQVSLDFLTIVNDHWPQILGDLHLSNPAFWRSQMIHVAALNLIKNPPSGPVIAAGSTGSIPATRALLHAIAHLPQGAVVLPGLDRDMDEESWQILDNATHDPSVLTHPQYGLNKLLASLGCERDNVVHLGHSPTALRQREYYLSASLRPAATTSLWASMPIDAIAMENAFADVALVEASGEREEALAIAVILRETLENEHEQAALVTSDRTLARRVVAELKRFGIRVDDSSGRPLLETEPVALIRLLLDCIFYPGDVVAFLSTLKHPLTKIGYQRDILRRSIEKLELFALRGGTGRISLSETPGFIADRLLQITQSESGDFARLNLEFIEEAQRLGAAIGEAARPLAELAAGTVEITLAQALQATIACFENFGRDENGKVDDLYAHEAGQALAQCFDRLMVERSGLTFKPQEWPEIFKALLKDETVRMAPFSHPQLAIWGGLEARLQPVDVMVLGGLNEGSWPQAVRGDPFLSRGMKASLGLAPPEQRIGLAAHDFQMAMGAKRLVMTRSLRQENAPQVASRWLQRLLTLCGEEEAQRLRRRGEKYLHWARALDEAADVPFAPRPCPKPPVSVRPKHFSVTEIDILRRDPYAIYAKRILRLRPLPPLIRDGDVQTRGQLYHAILASLATMMEQLGTARLPPDDVMRIVRAEFDLLQLPIDIEAIWWPRFLALLPEILWLEQQSGPRQRLAETISNKIDINDSGFSLSGRADRIDVLPDGRAEIIDFKTGSTPSLKQARTLAAPQLALEGAVLLRGGFVECASHHLADFIYVRLGAHGEVKWERFLDNKDKNATELAEEAWTRLDALVRLFGREEHGFISHALPRLGNYEGDYDHLARLAEWSASGGASGFDDD